MVAAVSAAALVGAETLAVAGALADNPRFQVSTRQGIAKQ
jgi:hypothetical protein